MIGWSVLLVAAAVQSPAVDSLRLLATRAPAPALVAEARARPLLVREAIGETFARAVRSPDRDAAELLAARRLAHAYAVAWSDSFLVGQVERFAASPRARRAAKVWADSVRRAGVDAYGKDGAAAAIVIWHGALARAQAIGDTAGSAALLGNLGAGFYTEGRLDSAVTYLTRAGAFARALGDVRVEANAIGTLADVHAERGDLEQARAGYSRALTLRERIGDTRGVASTYNNLGLLAQDLGDLSEARRQLEAALALNRREGRDEVAATNLVNLAGLASLDGDFARAETLYTGALATWRAREEWANAADAMYGLGQLELRRGDYPSARVLLADALAVYDRTGPPATVLAVHREMAAASAAAGDVQGALDRLRDAEHLADSAQVGPDVRGGLALARADLTVQLNALAEAEDLYRTAEALYREADAPLGLAEAQHGRAFLLLEHDDHAGAEALLHAAERTQRATGNRRGAALTDAALGRVARARGDTAAARRLLARAAAELDELNDPVAAAAATGERAELEATAGLPAAAEALYRSALARVEGRVAPEVTWRLRLGLALARRAQGATEEAVRELRAAVADVERPSRSLALAERRAAFLADKWDVYAQLALVETARGRPAAAFEASERLRARETLELLARGRVAPADTAAELIAREQDLRRRIAELTRGLEIGSGGPEALRGPDVTFASGASREALVHAQQAYAALLLEIRERAPRHAALVAPEPAGWRDVARRLARDEALIEYLVSDSGAVAFVVTHDTIAVAALGVARRELARLVEFVRGTIERAPDRAARDGLWRGPLRRLHGYLVGPLERAGLLAGKRRLIVVPHAELHYLPFAALLDGAGAGRFLIERYELAVTPSASVWLAIGARPPAPRAGGVLALAPRPDRLPASRREVAAIPRLLDEDARVLTGAAATEEALRADVAQRRIVHLATYGVLNKHNPLFSFVELAPGTRTDGRLEVHEVFGLHLAADLVVLSACQTALGSGTLADVPAGDDWVSFTRAFLHAGARSVVATLWPVDDRASADLMEAFYAAFAAGAQPSAALAAAQRRLLDARGTAHPFYWAGFAAAEGGPRATHETPVGEGL